MPMAVEALIPLSLHRPVLRKKRPRRLRSQNARGVVDGASEGLMMTVRCSGGVFRSRRWAWLSSRFRAACRRDGRGQVTHRALQLFEALSQLLTASLSVLHSHWLKRARRERR